MKRWVGVLLIFFTSVTPVMAQTAAPGHAFSTDMAAEIDRIALDQVHGGRTPGLAIGVVEDGLLVYARGFGFANLAKHTRFGPDTETYAGPITMQFTAAATLLLAQAGKISLDDRVTRYVPELTHAADGVTVGQLLQQTSGLPEVATLPGISTDPTHSVKIADLLAAIDNAKPSAKPGTSYENNPLNFIVAGVVVERASGETLSDYLQQQIFLPLVMERTFLAGDAGISASHAIGYIHESNQNDFTPVRPWDAAWLLGANGLVSTVDDLAKWDIEMPLLLRVDAVRTMFAPSVVPGATQYGMGWVIDRRAGHRYLWYAGGIGGYEAANALLPDDHVAVIVVTNAGSQDGTGAPHLSASIAAHVLDVVAPAVSVHLDNQILSRAKEWLVRLAAKQIDRTQLTPSFSNFLSDEFVAREDIASLGKLQSIVPLWSTTEPNGDTVYEFLVRYPRARYHYKFAVTSNGKIDEIELFA